jgi:glycosyltransferase involved in cell wall biosynthesis/GT2 family glycosyltransferase
MPDSSAEVNNKTFQSALIVRISKEDLIYLTEISNQARYTGFNNLLFYPADNLSGRHLKKLRLACDKIDCDSSQIKILEDSKGLLEQTEAYTWLAFSNASERLLLPTGAIESCISILDQIGLPFLTSDYLSSCGNYRRIVLAKSHQIYIPENPFEWFENEISVLLRLPMRASIVAISNSISEFSSRLVQVPTAKEIKSLSLLFSKEFITHAKGEFQSKFLNHNFRKARICLVSFEFIGATSSGGIGTAMSALAEILCRHGYELSVLFCPFFGPDFLPDSFLSHWAARKVKIEYLPRRVEGREYPQHEDFSWRLMNKLSEMGEFSIIHFHDSGGYGAMPLLCREAGLLFSNTKIVVTLHGPSQWHKFGNMLPWNLDEANQNHFEEVQHLLADVIISPSQYMLKWVLARHPMNGKTHVIPNPLPIESRSFESIETSKKFIPERLVFFGRIEYRKGFDIFLEAVNQLIESGQTHFKVAIYGRLGDGVKLDHLKQLTAAWPVTVEIETELSHKQVISRLREPNNLAVLPSRLDNSPYTIYECLENRIPLITTNIGGISELIDKADHDRVLIQPESPSVLAEKLQSALTNGIEPARLSFNITELDLKHIRIYESIIKRKPQIANKSNSDICVIVTGCADQESLDNETRAELVGINTVTFVNIGAENTKNEINSSLASLQSSYHLLEKAIDEAEGKYLIFLPASLRLRKGSFDALLNTITHSNVDAVCTTCEIVAEKDSSHISLLWGLAGPRELSFIRNIFGLGLFIIHKDRMAFPKRIRSIEYRPDIFCWFVLNDLLATGRKVLGLPLPFATAGIAHLGIGHVSPSREVSAMLGSPWVERMHPSIFGFGRIFDSCVHLADFHITAKRFFLHTSEDSITFDDLKEVSWKNADITTENIKRGSWEEKVSRDVPVISASEREVISHKGQIQFAQNLPPMLYDLGIKASVLVCTHNRPEGLRKLISSLKPQLKEKLDCELIIFNDGTHSSAYDAVIATDNSWINYHSSSVNLGIATARNRVASHARGEFLIFVDDDCEVEDGWLDWLLSRIQHQPNIDIIAGEVRPNLRDQSSTTANMQVMFNLIPRTRIVNQNVLFVTANLAIRHSFFDALGGFSEAGDFLGAGEDTEFALRSAELGARVEFDPHWVVSHALCHSILDLMERYYRYGLSTQWLSEQPASSQHAQILLTKSDSQNIIGLFLHEYRDALNISAKNSERHTAKNKIASLQKALISVAFHIGCKVAFKRIKIKLQNL